ncbi:MAG: hypothetical protein OWV35_02205 [Firmicutes bacterium]|nr:hypothetical protein [Bacillota bacterium]
MGARPPREPVRCPTCGMRFVGIARTPDTCPGCGHDFTQDWLPGAKDPNHPGPPDPGPWPPPFTPDPPPASPDPPRRRWPWFVVALPVGAGLWTGGFLTGYVLGVGQARAAVQALLRTPAYQGARVPLPALLGGLAGWWVVTLAILAGMAWMHRRTTGRWHAATGRFLQAAGAAALWEVMFHIGAALAA